MEDSQRCRDDNLPVLWDADKSCWDNYGWRKCIGGSDGSACKVMTPMRSCVQAGEAPPAAEAASTLQTTMEPASAPAAAAPAGTGNARLNILLGLDSHLPQPLLLLAAPTVEEASYPICYMQEIP